MESNLVAEFVSETGASFVEAHNFLQARGWDLKHAIHDYLMCDSVKVTDSGCKKLTRGISRANDNINVINRARCHLGLDFPENGVCNISQYFIETPVFTFTLPDLSIFPDDFREFLEKDLIEMSSLVSLEQAGRLNWWADNGVCQRLWPLATTGDGNCLLHAASLGMWGFHDRLLTLRRALHDFLSCSSYKDALWRRWRWQLTRLNAEAGLVYTEEEWLKEWESIVNMASSTPRNSCRRRSAVLEKSANKEVPENAIYESLEEIHVLALSHVLKRPIVVIADTVLKDVHGEALAPILFGGIYLPLEVPPSECHKSPLVLTFDAAHFSALVVMEKETFADKSPHPPAVIPLTDSHHKLLPVQFCVDPGENFSWGRDENVPSGMEKLSLGTKELHALLKEYLDVVYVPMSLSPLSDEVEFELELETPNDEEDIEKRFIEANGYDMDENVPEFSESSLFTTNKSRAAKQMKSVAKQFGSIGKSVSKRLKKNLGTITKMTKSNSHKKDAMIQSKFTNDDLVKAQDYILGARLHTEARHEYQEEMIKNYLITARGRFEREKRLKQKIINEDTVFDDEKLHEQAKLEGPKNCITQGCTMYGTVLTSYLCTNCYNKQRQEELNTSINSPSLPRAIIPKKSVFSNENNRKSETAKYETGRSTFYLEASPKSYESSKNRSVSSGKSLKSPDEAIYRSNSTFYDTSPRNSYNPKDWKNSRFDSSYNVLPHSLTNECSAKSFAWQEGVRNQIDTSELLTCPAELSSASSQFADVEVPTTRNEADDVDGNLIKINVRACDSPESKYHQPYFVESRLLKKVNNNSKNIQLQGKTQLQPARKSVNAEKASDSDFQVRSSADVKTINNNLIQLSVRESSQENLDKMLREAAEYYDKNGETKSDLRVIPVGLSQVNNVENGNVPTGNSPNETKAYSDYVDRKLCLNVTCKFFGSPELDNYCSQCYRGRYEVLYSSKK